MLIFLLCVSVFAVKKKSSNIISACFLLVWTIFERSTHCTPSFHLLFLNCIRRKIITHHKSTCILNTFILMECRLKRCRRITNYRFQLQFTYHFFVISSFITCNWSLELLFFFSSVYIYNKNLPLIIFTMYEEKAEKKLKRESERKWSKEKKTVRKILLHACFVKAIRHFWHFGIIVLSLIAAHQPPCTELKKER